METSIRKWIRYGFLALVILLPVFFLAQVAGFRDIKDITVTTVPTGTDIGTTRRETHSLGLVALTPGTTYQVTVQVFLADESGEPKSALYQGCHPVEEKVTFTAEMKTGRLQYQLLERTKLTTKEEKALGKDDPICFRWDIKELQ